MQWERRDKRFKTWERLALLLLALKIEDEGHESGNGLASRSWEWLSAASQQEYRGCIRVMQPQRIGLSQQTQMSKATDSSLTPPERNQSANILTSAWWGPCKGFGPAELSDNKFVLFKQLSLWRFVVAAILIQMVW